jgi:hypothetical protein
MPRGRRTCNPQAPCSIRNPISACSDPRAGRRLMPACRAHARAGHATVNAVERYVDFVNTNGGMIMAEQIAAEDDTSNGARPSANAPSGPKTGPSSSTATPARSRGRSRRRCASRASRPSAGGRAEGDRDMKRNANEPRRLLNRFAFRSAPSVRHGLHESGDRRTRNRRTRPKDVATSLSGRAPDPRLSSALLCQLEARAPFRHGQREADRNVVRGTRH